MGTILQLKETGSGVVFELTVQPRASKTGVAGEYGGTIKLRVAAPPVDSKANEECIRFLASALDVPRSSVSIVKGIASRRKTVSVSNVSAQEVRRALGLEG